MWPRGSLQTNAPQVNSPASPTLPLCLLFHTLRRSTVCPMDKARGPSAAHNASPPHTLSPTGHRGQGVLSSAPLESVCHSPPPWLTSLSSLLCTPHRNTLLSESSFPQQLADVYRFLRPPAACSSPSQKAVQTPWPALKPRFSPVTSPHPYTFWPQPTPTPLTVPARCVFSHL